MRKLLTSTVVILMVLLLITPQSSAECECDLNGDSACNGYDWLLFYPDWGRTDCPRKTIIYVLCNGDLSPGGRWCDNYDGTVTDMTTGLIWLKDASWGGEKLGGVNLRIHGALMIGTMPTRERVF